MHGSTIIQTVGNLFIMRTESNPLSNKSQAATHNAQNNTETETKTKNNKKSIKRKSRLN